MCDTLATSGWWGSVFVFFRSCVRCDASPGCARTCRYCPSSHFLPPITVLGGCQCYRAPVHENLHARLGWPVFWNPRPFRHPLNDLYVNVAWQSDITPWFLANRSVRLVWPSIQWSYQRTSSGSNIPPNIWGTTVNKNNIENLEKICLAKRQQKFVVLEELLAVRIKKA